MNKQEYQKYLKSDHWKEFRKTAIEHYQRCFYCNKKHKLHVHHLSYKNIGKESLADVIVACPLCHLKIHSENKQVANCEKLIRKIRAKKKFIPRTKREKRMAKVAILSPEPIKKKRMKKKRKSPEDIKAILEVAKLPDHYKKPYLPKKEFKEIVFPNQQIQELDRI